MTDNTFNQNLELSKSLTASVWERLENLGMAKGGPGSGPHKGGGDGALSANASPSSKAEYHQSIADHHAKIASDLQSKITNEFKTQGMSQARLDPKVRDLADARDANRLASDTHGEVASDYRSNSPEYHAVAENNANQYANKYSAAADKVNAAMGIS
jgi:hypothetical protein